ncbi:YqgE/AlgH family protein [Nannocystaceae bacterium ST9]
MSPVHAREAPSLARHLLCAVPQLLDPNFHRSVVLMLEHGQRGALGLVLNNPMPTTLREVAESLDLEWAGDPEARVRLGGPVEPVRGWILHDQPEWDAEGESVAPGLWLTTSLDPVIRAEHTRFGADDARFLFLLGYAGWARGQLEAEIAAGSWVLVPVLDPGEEVGSGVQVDFLFDAPPDEMWQLALEAIGVDPQRLVGMQGSQTLH